MKSCIAVMKFITARDVLIHYGGYDFMPSEKSIFLMNKERQAKHSWIPLSLPTNSGLFFPKQYLPMKINRPSTLGSPCFYQIPTGLSFPDNFFFWIGF